VWRGISRVEVPIEITFERRPFDKLRVKRSESCRGGPASEPTSSVIALRKMAGSKTDLPYGMISRRLGSQDRPTKQNPDVVIRATKNWMTLQSAAADIPPYKEAPQWRGFPSKSPNKLLTNLGVGNI
jgi:hypothetical protein